MASLRDVVSEYQDDLRNGIAWLAFWREGRSCLIFLHKILISSGAKEQKSRNLI